MCNNHGWLHCRRNRGLPAARATRPRSTQRKFSERLASAAKSAPHSNTEARQPAFFDVVTLGDVTLDLTVGADRHATKQVYHEDGHVHAVRLPRHRVPLASHGARLALNDVASPKFCHRLASNLQSSREDKLVGQGWMLRGEEHDFGNLNLNVQLTCEICQNV